MQKRQRFTAEFKREAVRLLEAGDRPAAAIATSPFSCRGAEGRDTLLWELIIAFGAVDDVALFEIEDPQTVTVLAVRHQREDDYSIR